MLITSIAIDGWKGWKFRHELAPLTFIYGPNGSGKTAHLDAIRLVAEKATTGVGKKNAQIMALCPHKSMNISVGLDTEGMFIRAWKRAMRKGKETVSQSISWTRADSAKQAEAALERVFGVKSMVMDPVAFMEGSDAKRREMVLRSLQSDRWTLEKVREAVATAIDKLESSVRGTVPAPTSTDGVEAAMEIAAVVHEKRLEADRERKRLEKLVEGMADTAGAVSGQVMQKQRERVQTLRTAKEAALKDLTTAQERDRAMKKWLERSAAAKIAQQKLPELQQRIESITAAQTQYEKALEEQTDLGYKLGQQTTQIQHAKAELAAAKAGTCPICKQQIPLEAVEDLEAQLEMLSMAAKATEKKIEERRKTKKPPPIPTKELQSLSKQAQVPEQPPEAYDVEQLVEVLHDQSAAVELAQKRLEELEKERAAAALRDQNENSLVGAREAAAFWKELDAALGTKGLLGKIVRDLSESFGAEVAKCSSLPIEISDEFVIGMRRGESFVPLEGLSGAQKAEVLVAIAAAIERGRAAEWHGILVDDVDRFDEVALPRFLDALERAQAEGWIDQAIVCGWFDPKRENWHTITTEVA